MSDYWGANNWHKDENSPEHEANLLTLDCTKANNILGWKPKWNIDKSLSLIVDWYKKDLSGSNMRNECLKRIEEYMYA